MYTDWNSGTFTPKQTGIGIRTQSVARLGKRSPNEKHAKEKDLEGDGGWFGGGVDPRGSCVPADLLPCLHSRGGSVGWFLTRSNCAQGDFVPIGKAQEKGGGGRRRLLQSRLCKLAQLRAEPTTTNSAAHRSNGRAKIISSGGAPFFLLASAPHPPYFPSAPTPHLFLCCQPANDMQGWSERQPDIKARRKGHFPLLDKKVTLRLRFFGFF